jgi:hypothetical protein
MLGSERRIRPFNLETTPTNGLRDLVPVSPTSLRKSEIDEMTHTVRLARWSVFGFVTYKRRGAAAIVRGEARSGR